MQPSPEPSTASGELHANAFSVIPTDNALLAQKAPIRSFVPSPSAGFSYGGAVVSWAKNPNAGLVALNFLMSVPGQSAIVTINPDSTKALSVASNAFSRSPEKVIASTLSG